MIAVPCYINIVWQIEAPIEPVWATVMALEQWPRWWDSVEKVTIIKPGKAGGINTVFATKWKIPLPVSIDAESRITQIKPPVLLEHVSESTITSVVQWHLGEVEWGTLLCFTWGITHMNPIAREMLRPLPQFLLDEVLLNAMKTGGQGLARFLGATYRGTEIGENAKRSLETLQKNG